MVWTTNQVRERVINLIKSDWYQVNRYYCYRDNTSALSWRKKLPSVQRAPNLMSGDLSLSLGFSTYCGLGRSPPLNPASLSLQWILPLPLHRVIMRIKHTWELWTHCWAQTGAQMFSSVQGWFLPLLINLCLMLTWLGFGSISTNSPQSYLNFMLKLLTLPLMWQSLTSAMGEREHKHILTLENP